MFLKDSIERIKLEAVKQAEQDYGLSIADMIVTGHGGTIKASHNGEKGTVFTIRLPR